ncbi:hypothetical protein HKX48_005739 [Thoreauomyces humboldtii]|nr:hypothetical protein HKX48_005739 [Thoreauomyces humboldtii]
MARSGHRNGQGPSRNNKSPFPEAQDLFWESDPEPDTDFARAMAASLEQHHSTQQTVSREEQTASFDDISHSSKSSRIDTEPERVIPVDPASCQVNAFRSRTSTAGSTLPSSAASTSSHRRSVQQLSTSETKRRTDQFHINLLRLYNVRPIFEPLRRQTAPPVLKDVDFPELEEEFATDTVNETFTSNRSQKVAVKQHSEDTRSRHFAALSDRDDHSVRAMQPTPNLQAALDRSQFSIAKRSLHASMDEEVSDSASYEILETQKELIPRRTGELPATSLVPSKRTSEVLADDVSSPAADDDDDTDRLILSTPGVSSTARRLKAKSSALKANTLESLLSDSRSRRPVGYGSSLSSPLTGKPNTLASPPPSRSPPSSPHAVPDASSETICPLCNEFFHPDIIAHHAATCDGPVVDAAVDDDVTPPFAKRPRRLNQTSILEDVVIDSEEENMGFPVPLHVSDARKTRSIDEGQRKLVNNVPTVSFIQCKHCKDWLDEDRMARHNSDKHGLDAAGEPSPFGKDAVRRRMKAAAAEMHKSVTTPGASKTPRDGRTPRTGTTVRSTITKKRKHTDDAMSDVVEPRTPLGRDVAPTATSRGDGKARPKKRVAVTESHRSKTAFVDNGTPSVTNSAGRARTTRKAVFVPAKPVKETEVVVIVDTDDEAIMEEKEPSPIPKRRRAREDSPKVVDADTQEEEVPGFEEQYEQDGTNTYDDPPYRQQAFSPESQAVFPAPDDPDQSFEPDYPDDQAESNDDANVDDHDDHPVWLDANPSYSVPHGFDDEQLSPLLGFENLSQEEAGLDWFLPPAPAPGEDVPVQHLARTTDPEMYKTNKGGGGGGGGRFKGAYRGGKRGGWKKGGKGGAGRSMTRLDKTKILMLWTPQKRARVISRTNRTAEVTRDAAPEPVSATFRKMKSSISPCRC